MRLISKKIFVVLFFLIDLGMVLPVYAMPSVEVLREGSTLLVAGRPALQQTPVQVLDWSRFVVDPGAVISFSRLSQGGDISLSTRTVNASSTLTRSGFPAAGTIRIANSGDIVWGAGGEVRLLTTSSISPQSGIFSALAVPEPRLSVLMLLGLAAIGFSARRRQRN